MTAPTRRQIMAASIAAVGAAGAPAGAVAAAPDPGLSAEQVIRLLRLLRRLTPDQMLDALARFEAMEQEP